MISFALLLAILIAAVFLILNSTQVQTRLGHWAANNLSKKLETRVELERLDIDFFNRVTLEGLLIFDQQNDTLLFAERINLTIRRFAPSKNTFKFGKLELDHAVVKINALDTVGTKNLDFVVDYFRPAKSEIDTTRDISDLSLTAAQLILNNCRFAYRNPFAEAALQLMDFNNLDFSEVNAFAETFSFKQDTLAFDMNAFAFQESSGFNLKNLSGGTLIHPNAIVIEGLNLITDHSKLYGDLVLQHQDWKNYQNFTKDVELSAHFDTTLIALSDIGYFASELHEVKFVANLAGDFSGTINNLKGRGVFLSVGENTIFRGNFDVEGLPDAENAFIDLRIKQLSSNFYDLGDIGVAITRNPDFDDQMPAEFERSGNLFFEGSFTGFPQDFVAYGALTTDAGMINLDLNLKTDSATNRIEYKGGVEAIDFDIGRILAQSELGKVSAKVEISAFSREKLESAQLVGNVRSLIFSGYDYTNVNVDGTVSKNKFTGQINSRDPNLNFDFDGVVDFSGSEPILNFNADIYNADLTRLNLVNLEQNFSLSAKLTLNAQGKSINKVNGSLIAFDSFLCFGDSVLFLDEFRLTAAGDISNRKISFTSDFADVAITGAFDIEQLPQSFAILVGQVLPSLVEYKPVTSQEVFDFSINYKTENIVTGMFIPGLDIAAGSTAYGSYNSQSRDFELLLRSDSLRYGDFAVKDATLDMGKVSEAIKAKLYGSEVSVGKLALENFDLDFEAYNDIAQVGLGWVNAGDALSGDLSARINFLDKSHFQLQLLPGFIGSEQSDWSIDSTLVTIDSTMVFVDNLVFQNRDQKFYVHGAISHNATDELTVRVENFDFATLDSIGIKMDKTIQGKMNLTANIQDFYEEKVIRAEGNISDLIYDRYQIGDIKMSSRYYGDEKQLALSGSLTRRGAKILDFKGDYTIGSKTPLDAKLMLDDFDLNILNAFNIPEVNEYSGLAQGEIGIKGNFDEPSLQGYIDFENARFKVEYLNTYFQFSDRLRVEDGWFGIDYKPLYDEQGHKGFVVASAFHEDYSNWTYDISVEANNFFLMNTTRDMNDTYYGIAYGTGTMQIGGYQGFLEINIDAATDKGTSVKLPLDNQEDVTLENFVYFINKSEETEERSTDLSGVQLRLNLDATPDAEVQIIFDERSGDIIRGRGSGKLTLEIAPSGEFLMFGRYEITEGSYLFTLKNLINKQFQLRSGGYIGWYGDPYVADIDLSAIYRLRSPLYPIMVENPDRYRGREDINVVLNLTDKLLNPSISFGVELPQATDNERSQLASAVSTTQQLNQQVFALLILNRFLPVQETQETAAVSSVSGLGSATTSDFVSTQISNWLSEISDEFDIGVNYRPGDQISNQEIAVALSTQLFNERLSVRGNFGVTSASESQYTQSQTGILGDFLVEYSLTEDGKIRLKVFNETNPYQVFSTASTIYTQGAGLVYQEDFDTLDEFFSELKGLFTNDKAKKDVP